MIAKDSTIKKWLREKAIQVHLSSPYYHSQNGQIERDIQTVLDKARTLLADTENMLNLWGYAVKYAIYTYNRTHVPQSTRMTPYEAVYGTLPDVSYLLPFYTPGVYHLTKEERKGKTWAFKAAPCRMVGYAEEGKGVYWVLTLPHMTLTKRKDCVFDESIHAALKDAQRMRSYDKAKIEDLFKRIDGTTEEEEETSVYLMHCIQDENEEHSVESLNEWMDDMLCLSNVAPIKLPHSPATLSEAFNDEDKVKWKEAVQKEVDQLKELNVFKTATE